MKVVIEIYRSEIDFINFNYSFLKITKCVSIIKQDMTIFELYTEDIWLEEHVMYVIKYIIHYMSIVFPSGMQLSLNYANLGVQLLGLNSPEGVCVCVRALLCMGMVVCVCVCVCVCVRTFPNL